MSDDLYKIKVKLESRRMGRHSHSVNSTSSPFEPYSDRYWWWLEGWDEAESEKQAKRSNSARTKIYPE